MGLYLYSPTWQLPDDDHVAFSFFWPNCFEELPAVSFYLPCEDAFPPRNELLRQVLPKLKQSGFTDIFESGDPNPSWPVWKDIPLEDFHRESGFDQDTFVEAIVNGFRSLLEIEPLIEEAFRSMGPGKPPLAPSERRLRTIAFLDTECAGQGATSTMTELAIINAAYDVDEDMVRGILEEYCMNAGEPLDKAGALGALGRAEFIVAHNAFGCDRPLVARYLPGTENMNWLCSLQGMDWVGLLGVESARLETLLGKAGLKCTQDHHAHADALDLERLLALKRKGRTYLGRLLDAAEPKADSARR